MTDRDPPRTRTRVFDMRLDGSFPPPPGTPVAARIAGTALGVAVLVGALALAALVLWLVLWAIVVLVPIALLAGAVAWVAYRYQAWKTGGSRGPHDVFRR